MSLTVDIWVQCKGDCATVNKFPERMEVEFASEKFSPR